MASQIGAQMFTLRDFCETPSDIAKTCQRLKDMGFDAIQASAAGFSTIEADELKKILDDTGMVCAATHMSLDRLKDVDAAVEWHKTVGCELTAIGGFGFGGASKADWQAFAKDFNELAATLGAKGLKLGYHNHSHELAPFEEDPAKIDPSDTPYHLLRETATEHLWFEVDTYWVAHAGADPTVWMEHFAGHLPAIHVKDLTITPKREHKMCEVGAGNLNWPAIIATAKKLGVKWYLIERDNGDLDPFDSLKISLENLHKLGVE